MQYTITLTYDGDAESREQAAEDFLEWVAQLNAGDVLDAAVIEEDEPTYKIVRFFQDDRDTEVITRGLTLEQAQEHCRRDDTHGDGWFDGYETEAS